MVAALMAPALVALPVLVVWLRSHGKLSSTSVLAAIGLEVSALGTALTPGIGWGSIEDHSARRGISTVVFYIGVAVLIVAASRWWRHRRQHSE